MKLTHTMELTWHVKRSDPCLTYAETTDAGNVFVWLNIAGYEIRVRKLHTGGEKPQWEGAMVDFPHFGERDIGAAVSIRRLLDEVILVATALDTTGVARRGIDGCPLTVRSTGFAWDDYSAEESKLLAHPRLLTEPACLEALGEMVDRRGGRVYARRHGALCDAVSRSGDRFGVETQRAFDALKD